MMTKSDGCDVGNNDNVRVAKMAMTHRTYANINHYGIAPRPLRPLTCFPLGRPNAGRLEVHAESRWKMCRSFSAARLQLDRFGEEMIVEILLALIAQRIQ